MTLDLRGRLTLPVYPDAADLFGLGRDATYAAVENGDIESFRQGRTIRVLTVPALRQLGWPDDLIARALGVDLEPTPERTEAGPASGPATVVHLPPAREDRRRPW